MTKARDIVPAEGPKALLSMGKLGDARLDYLPPADSFSPGLEPLEYNLVVCPAFQPNTIGAVYIPEEAQERLELAMQLGRVVAVSPLAFNYDAWPEGSRPPQPGDVVWFARFAGGEFVGLDGITYRLVKDKDVGARITAPMPSVAEEVVQRMAEARYKASGHTAAEARRLAGLPEEVLPLIPAASVEPIHEARRRPGLDRLRAATGQEA